MLIVPGIIAMTRQNTNMNFLSEKRRREKPYPAKKDVIIVQPVAKKVVHSELRKYGNISFVELNKAMKLSNTGFCATGKSESSVIRALNSTAEKKPAIIQNINGYKQRNPPTDNAK